MLVDTGATMVALTADDRRAPRRLRRSGDAEIADEHGQRRLLVSPVVLRQVSLGSIYMNDVQAVVMPPGAGTANLFGASFLKRLAGVEQRDGVLVLRQ